MKTKLTVLLLVIAALLLAMTGCAQQPQEPEQAELSPEIVETVVTPVDMSGTLVSFVGSSLTITNEQDSNDYTFDVSQAEVSAKNMVAGDEIVVFYTGEIAGTDTAAVTVVKVEDLGGAPTQQEEHEVAGNLVYIGENTITIQLNDGTQLTFNSTNCEHDFKNGLKEGNWVSVNYLGELNGSDASGVKVLKITDDDDNAVIQEVKESMQIEARDETVYCTANSGVNIRASYSSDAKILGALAKGQSIHRSGVCANGWSRVTYNGEDAYIYGDYLSTTAPATPAPTTAPAPTATPAPAPAAPEEHTISGSVVEASMNTISVAPDGYTDIYTFDVSDATHHYANGIQTGNRVTITYTGDISNAIVSLVVDEDENATSGSQYTGTVLGATMNTITIQTDDGAQITFDKEDAQSNVSSILEGDRICVTADPSMSEPDSNILFAAVIDPA